jgi:uncharacterized membrane protein
MKKISSLRTRYQYNAAIMFVGSLLAAFASFALTVDAFILAKTTAKTLGCDVNGNISCSSVARSWQSNLVYIWGVNVPNAVFGLLFMGIFIGFTAALMFGYRPGRIVTGLFSAGIVVCVLFALWLLGVSVLWLHVLCPWCLTLDAAIILQVIGYVRWMRTKDGDVKRHPLVSSLISIGIEVIPLLALLAIIVVNWN